MVNEVHQFYLNAGNEKYRITLEVSGENDGVKSGDFKIKRVYDTSLLNLFTSDKELASSVFLNAYNYSIKSIFENRIKNKKLMKNPYLEDSLKGLLLDLYTFYSDRQDSSILEKYFEGKREENVPENENLFEQKLISESYFTSKIKSNGLEFLLSADINNQTVNVSLFRKREKTFYGILSEYKNIISTDYFFGDNFYKFQDQIVDELPSRYKYLERDLEKSLKQLKRKILDEYVPQVEILEPDQEEIVRLPVKRKNILHKNSNGMGRRKKKTRRQMRNLFK